MPILKCIGKYDLGTQMKEEHFGLVNGYIYEIENSVILWFEYNFLRKQEAAPFSPKKVLNFGGKRLIKTAQRDQLW